MDVLRDAEWTRPVPGPDDCERPFFEAAARGELIFQRCRDCGHGQHYPRAVCTACGSDPEWSTVSGQGTVHTFTIVRQNFAKPFKAELPYVVAIIELPEGVRMMGNVTGCSPDEVQVGMPVEAYAVVFEDGLAVPFWRTRPV